MCSLYVDTNWGDEVRAIISDCQHILQIMHATLETRISVCKPVARRAVKFQLVINLLSVLCREMYVILAALRASFTWNPGALTTASALPDSAAVPPSPLAGDPPPREGAD